MLLTRGPSRQPRFRTHGRRRRCCGLVQCGLGVAEVLRGCRWRGVRRRPSHRRRDDRRPPARGIFGPAGRRGTTGRTPCDVHRRLDQGPLGEQLARRFEPGPDAGLGGISPLVWVECSTGRPGCMELSVDWGVPQLENAWLFSVEDAPGGGARLALGRDYWASASGYQSESLILDTDGGAVFAMRHDGDYGCHELWLGDFSSGRTAATLALVADASVTQYRQVLGTPEGAGREAGAGLRILQQRRWHGTLPIGQRHVSVDG